jgi:hypothetical protein
MKALLHKELRENLAVAILGLLIFGALLVMAYRDCTAVTVVTSPIYDSRSAIMQPLVASNLLRDTSIFCAVFGAILGWLQVHREKHRDLWAYLIHRPLPRTRILMCKAFAGLAVYVLVTGLPLAGLVFWVSIPGHVLAPFEWPMVWPVTACFLAGSVYYLAGMLTGLRQARWYASRGLALGLAITVSITILAAPWWIGLAALLLGGAVLTVAVLGSFLSDGYFEGQPTLGKAGLVLALTVGTFLVLTLVAAVVGNSLLRSNDYTSSYYQMTKNGRIYRFTYTAGRVVRAQDLNGEQVKDPKTGRPSTPEQLTQQACPGSMLTLDFEGPSRSRSSWDSARFFTVWRVTEQEVWYYWVRFGRLVGFGLGNRQLVGSFGPDGFANDFAAAQGRFRPPSAWNVGGQQHTLTSSTGVYHVEIESRTIQLLFTTSADDPIGGAADVSISGTGWDYTLAATKRSVLLLTPDAKVVWKVARDPADPSYTDIRVFFLGQTNRYAVWLAPSYQANMRAGWTLPTHVVWLDSQGGELKRTELAALPQFQFNPGLQEQLFGIIAPPGLAFVMAKTLLQAPSPYKLSLLALASAVVCAGIGFVLCRRYAFSAREQASWALFHLIFGLPGFLAFLAVQEWPAHERCPACHKLRVVDREQCEHCGANFAPPPQTGTEIFEPLRTG